MNNRIKTFLDDVCIHINCKAVHSDIREELTQHINDLKDEYIKQGYDEEKALESAVLAMGNCDEIGIRLNKQHKPQAEWSLLVLTFLIAAFGCAIIYVSSNFDKQAVHFSRYLFYAVIGIGAMLSLYFFDYTKLKKYAFPMYISAMSLLIITSFIGVSVNGAKRWIVIGPFSISSASFASVLFIISFIGFLEKYKGEKVLGIVKLIGLGFISFLPIMAQPNLSVVFIMTITYAIVLFKAISKNHFSGNKKIQLLSLSGLGLAGVLVSVFFVFSTKYRIARIFGAFSRGQHDPGGSGWQQVMVDKWLFSSKLFGRTSEIAEGSLEFTLPGLTSDYVLVNIIASFGWIVGIALVLIISIFIIRLFVTTKKVKSGFGYYLSLSACTLISAQFIISILLNFNLFRFIGVDMPFVSYGGSGYIVCMALVGIILSVWRRNNLISYKTEENAAITSSKNIINFTDGKLVIDFKAWK